MKRFAFAVLLIIVLAASAFAALNRPGAEASPKVIIRVSHPLDVLAVHDGMLTLREAIMLATGGLLLSQLGPVECTHVPGAVWVGLPASGHCASSDRPGEDSADIIVFDTTEFPPGSPETINLLMGTLPELDTGDDTVDGSAAGVIVEGGGTGDFDFDCFKITSNRNTIKGLEIRNCRRAVSVRGGADNTIGGSTTAGQCSGDCNVISGNGIGVRIEGSDTAGNTVKGNFIGTNAAGDGPIPNDRGVAIAGSADNNTIGGSSPDERNVISGCYLGVIIRDSGTTGNVVQGNYIGTNADGTAALPNGVGVAIGFGAQNNTIGGGSEAQRNLISGNGAGVDIELTGTTGNVVKNNYIGTNAAGEDPIPNEVGVDIANGAQYNTIGGTGGGEPNLIAFNNGNGVRVRDADSTGNTIRGNYIHHNGEKGIENQDGGNEELEPPTISGFGSVMGTACPNCIIDIYSDDEDEGGGYGGWTTADDDGNWSFDGSPEGPNVTATATDTGGNTSEFSEPVSLAEPTPSPTPSPSPTSSPTPSPTPPVGPTRTLVWDPGWHNATWSGASTPEEAFACAAGSYAAAYRYVGGVFQRYFPDGLDMSNMTDLGPYDTFFILITDDVTCEMPVADPPAAERTLNWGVGWHNEGWTGADGTDPEDAFACADGSYAAAYRLVEGSWESYFPGLPHISDMGPLNKYDTFLIRVTAQVSCTMGIAP